MEETLINGWILAGLLVGAGLLIVNRPGGSGFDAFDWQAGLPVRHRADRVRTSLKFLPRSRYAAGIGAALVVACLIAIVVRSL